MFVNFQPQHVRKPTGRSLRSFYQLPLPNTYLSRQVAACIALVCGVQCSMPVRLGHWQRQTSYVCSEMTEQWSDRIATSSRKILSPRDPRISTSFWRRKGSAGMDIWNLQWCSQDSLWPTGWWKAWAWEAQDDREAADREWKLSAIDSHERHSWRSGVRSAMRTASQLPGRGSTDLDVAPVTPR